MKLNDFIEIVLFLGLLIIMTPVLGYYMAKVFSAEDFKFKRLFLWFENMIYRTCGIDSNEQMNWKKYTFALLIFNFLGFLVVFILQLIQKSLPLNSHHL